MFGVEMAIVRLPSVDFLLSEALAKQGVRYSSAQAGWRIYFFTDSPIQLILLSCQNSKIPSGSICP